MPGFGPGPGPGSGGFGGPRPGGGPGPGHFGGHFGPPPPPRGFGWRRPYYGPRMGCGCLPWFLIIMTAVSALGALFLWF